MLEIVNQTVQKDQKDAQALAMPTSIGFVLAQNTN